jgi:protein-tyrosine-phosphatase/DNA-binding transcriptional ArsR family regulator
MTELSSEMVRRVQIHAALADRGRLAIVDRLLLADASPSELQSVLAMSSNLIAHHLGVLEGAGIVARTRSEGDRRRTYLRLIPEALEVMVPSTARHAERVVFVCSQNSARSQLAVALWHRSSSLPVASAGTHPASEVHPGAVAAAARHNLPMRPQAPQGLSNITVSPSDLIVAVCDCAHEELPADNRRIHWSIPDPAAQEAGDDAFDSVLDDLTDRIGRLAPTLQPR